MKTTPTLQERLAETEAKLGAVTKELAYYASLVGAFWEGIVPPTGATLEHFIIAQEGRKRLERLRSEPALLRGPHP